MFAIYSLAIAIAIVGKFKVRIDLKDCSHGAIEAAIF